jgi:hypothetical protein
MSGWFFLLPAIAGQKDFRYDDDNNFCLKFKEYGAS